MGQARRGEGDHPPEATTIPASFARGIGGGLHAASAAEDWGNPSARLREGGGEHLPLPPAPVLARMMKPDQKDEAPGPPAWPAASGDQPDGGERHPQEAKQSGAAGVAGTERRPGRLAELDQRVSYSAATLVSSSGRNV
jgi:hypothetical protein